MRAACECRSCLYLQQKVAITIELLFLKRLTRSEKEIE